MLLIVCTRHAVELNYSLKRHAEYIPQIIYIYKLYERFTVQFASVWLSLVCPNYYMYNHCANTHEKGNSI